MGPINNQAVKLHLQQTQEVFWDAWHVLQNFAFMYDHFLNGMLWTQGGRLKHKFYNFTT